MVLRFDPFEVSAPHIVYACLGGFTVLFGMLSLFIREKLYIGEAVLAFLFGVLIGPYGVNIFNPHDWGGANKHVTDIITLEFTRVVLAIGVFAIGVELPNAYMRRHWRSLLFLLGPVMTWGWFVSAALIYAFIPNLSFLSSLAVAACLTPTDPILASAVVGGKWADKHVPANIRHLLAAESGCNDGAAFPFLFLALYLLLYRNVGESIRDWFLLLWLYQIVLGTLIGAIFGFSFRHLMRFCQRRNLIDRHACVAKYISLALLTLGVTTLLGSDDLLACFACGAAFAWDGFFNDQTKEAVFSSVVDLLFNVTAFIYVGAWMPFAAFSGAMEIGAGTGVRHFVDGAPDTGLRVWRLLVIAILVLLLRRLPVIVGLYRWIPDITTLREAVFSGHFGPIGIGAVFISTLAVHTIDDDKHHLPHTAELDHLSLVIQPIVGFLVLASIATHGLSIPSFSLGRRVRTASRTWSRTYSMAGSKQPEWASQAKWVSRGGEDIVINRDRDREGNDVSKLEQGLNVTVEESSAGGGDVDVTDTITLGVSEGEGCGEVGRRNGDGEEKGAVKRQDSATFTLTQTLAGVEEGKDVDDGEKDLTDELDPIPLVLRDRNALTAESYPENYSAYDNTNRNGHDYPTDDREAETGADDEAKTEGGEWVWESDTESSRVAVGPTRTRTRSTSRRPSSSSSAAHASSHLHVVHHHHHYHHRDRGRNPSRGTSVNHSGRGSSVVGSPPPPPSAVKVRPGSGAGNSVGANEVMTNFPSTLPIPTSALSPPPSRSLSPRSSLAPLNSFSQSQSPPPRPPRRRPNTADSPGPRPASATVGARTANGNGSLRTASRPFSSGWGAPPHSPPPRGANRPGTADSVLVSAFSRRVEHLRGSSAQQSRQPSREASPVRQIRFLDEAGEHGEIGSGNGTGKLPRSWSLTT